jgi:F420-dependent oxidoreductase-like protein
MTTGVGIVVQEADTSASLRAIEAADALGVRDVWLTQPGRGTPDALSVIAAAAVMTERVSLGTAVVPTYPRHPLVLAQQVLAITDVAPGRFRLGVGPSHVSTIETMYGLARPTPLTHLEEYVTVLRELLWLGRSTHTGLFYSVDAELPRPARPPILISALRRRAFVLAGAVADGAISWLCPIRYLQDVAVPAIEAGSRAAGRPAPPLVAHVPVALTDDHDLAIMSALRAFGHAAKRPNYARMFEDAGHPIGATGEMPTNLAEELIVFGNDDQIAIRLEQILQSDIAEVMVTLVPTGNERAEATRLAHLASLIPADR